MNDEIIICLEYEIESNYCCIVWIGKQKVFTFLWTKGSMCFKQKEFISTLSVKPLEFVEQFIYLDSNISSTEKNINVQIAQSAGAVEYIDCISAEE